MSFYRRTLRDSSPLRPTAPDAATLAPHRASRACAAQRTCHDAQDSAAGGAPAIGTRAVSPAATRVSQSPRTRVSQSPSRRSASTGGVGYAVVDLETTGLSPAGDSILEIGLVLTAADGTVERGWSTLVHPGAGVDVGPTYIHGIVAEDLDGAPPLAAVADLLVRDLAGRAVVAHNARFDVGFLTHALGRLGYLSRGARVPRVCTMEMARRFMSTPSRRLLTCCEVAGVTIGQHHCALDDARAAAGLLRHYMDIGRRRGDEEPAWSRVLEEAVAFAGWRWNDDDAARQEALLVPRRNAGVPRAALPA